ncbi:rod-determining factor RdfA [Halorientalis halophila]|uniref:rod-determining factor RdfA n=1 Tax=Halorientalis halophila TaxID=3108499 RepID=UPI003008444F
MTQTQCKIEIVAERYGLDASEGRYGTVDERLLTRWTGADGRDPDGYRTLTEWFNKRLLKSVYDEHGRDTTGTRVSSDYQALTGDDDLLREEVMDDLRADGVDPERVRSDMVSWSTMRDHLNSCLDGEKEVEDSESDWERRSLEVAKNITRSKVREALSSLDTKDVLPEGDTAEIEIQILLSCPDCPIRIPVDDAVERGFVCKDHFPKAPSVEVES